mmetsp:Transcript_138449/g.240803  ORF Transcript_138449/g.240803 Transcript_138449/m.240803 type:complete len:89 (-) Transcript_138449:369-635(-)
MLADARRQGVQAICQIAVNWLIRGEAQHRSFQEAVALAQHGILVHCMRQRNAMVCEEALHRHMYSAAAYRDIAYICTQELPLTEAETQ